MVDLAPFRGQRFDPAVVGDLAAVTAPPYDAIDDEQQGRLHAASPYNVVRLELGEERDGDAPGHDRYSRAAATHAAWLAGGVLVEDDHERLYAYAETFCDGGRERTQVGVLGALELSAWEAGKVLPHERVFRGPVEDRKRLLAALPVNLSPVFVLAPRTPAAVARILDRVVRSGADQDVTDDTGVRHRLWPLPRADADTVRRAYADVRLLMADGHHRYTTALEHHHERPGAGTDRILAYVVGAERGPSIRATHRLVRRLRSGTVDRLGSMGLSVAPDAGTPHELAARVRDDQHAFGLVTREGAWLVTGTPTMDATPVDADPPVDELGITRLQSLLLGPLGVPDRIEDLVYTPDVTSAVAEVHSGGADALFLAPAVPFDVFEAAAVAGVRMPPKSTSFHPKPRTGLVLRPLGRRTVRPDRSAGDRPVASDDPGPPEVP